MSRLQALVRHDDLYPEYEVSKDGLNVSESEYWKTNYLKNKIADSHVLSNPASFPVFNSGNPICTSSPFWMNWLKMRFTVIMFFLYINRKLTGLKIC